MPLWQELKGDTRCLPKSTKGLGRQRKGIDRHAFRARHDERQARLDQAPRRRMLAQQPSTTTPDRIDLQQHATVDQRSAEFLRETREKCSIKRLGNLVTLSCPFPDI